MPKSPLPLTAFEEYMLRDDRPAFPMSIVARLRFEGSLDRVAAAAALEQTIARHPLLRATVRNAAKGRPHWDTVDRAPTIQWTSDLAHDRLPAMRTIDLTTEPGLRAWATTDAQSSTMVLQMHHAACDGKAVLQVAGDFLRSYARAIDRDQTAIEPSDRDEQMLPRRASFGLTAWKLLKMLPAQLTGLVRASDFLFHQPVALANRTGEAASEKENVSGVCVASLAANELRRLSAAAAARGVSVNDWLLRDFFVAVAEFRRHESTDRNEWIRVSVPVDLRRPADARLPAANVVSMVFLDRKAKHIADGSHLLHGIHDEMDAIRRRQLGLTFIWALMAARKLPGGLAARVSSGRCESTCVLSNLGRALANSTLPLKGGRIVAGNVVLDGIDFFVPVREGTAASVALIFYAGGLQFCLQYDGRRITAAQAEALLASYVHNIRSSLGMETLAGRVKAA